MDKKGGTRTTRQHRPLRSESIFRSYVKDLKETNFLPSEKGALAICNALSNGLLNNAHLPVIADYRDVCMHYRFNYDNQPGAAFLSLIAIFCTSLKKLCKMHPHVYSVIICAALQLGLGDTLKAPVNNVSLFKVIIVVCPDLAWYLLKEPSESNAFPNLCQDGFTEPTCDIKDFQKPPQTSMVHIARSHHVELMKQAALLVPENALYDSLLSLSYLQVGKSICVYLLNRLLHNPAPMLMTHELTIKVLELGMIQGFNANEKQAVLEIFLSHSLYVKDAFPQIQSALRTSISIKSLCGLIKDYLFITR